LGVYGESFFERGEELFMKNKPEEAVTMLEAAINEDPGNEKVYLYLGIVYEQLGDHEKAISVLEAGIEVTDSMDSQFLFNLGNNYYALGKYEEAVNTYTRALKEKPGRAEALLNRANAYMKLEKRQDALKDYKRYIVLKPLDSQKSKIEKVIAILEQRITEERQKKIEEEAKRLAEERSKEEEEKKRLEEEKRKAAEEKKRQEALLDEVLGALEQASSDTKSLSAESEDIQELEGELELDE